MRLIASAVIGVPPLRLYVECVQFVGGSAVYSTGGVGGIAIIRKKNNESPNS